MSKRAAITPQTAEAVSESERAELVRAGEALRHRLDEATPERTSDYGWWEMVKADVDRWLDLTKGMR